MNNVQRAARSLLPWLFLLGGVWIGHPVFASGGDVFVESVVPEEVATGQSFRVYGGFAGVTSASAYLSDGIWGLPLEVLEVTDTYIQARVEALPWPITGAVHVLVHDDVTVLPELTWPVGEFRVKLVDGFKATVTQSASGGVLTVSGEPPPHPPNISMTYNGGLNLDPDDPCAPHTTTLVLIEPDLENPSDLQAVGCIGVAAHLPLAMRNDTAMTGEAFYTAMAEGLNQLFAADGVVVTYDPSGGTTGDGVLSILQPGCPETSGSVGFFCQ